MLYFLALAAVQAIAPAAAQKPLAVTAITADHFGLSVADASLSAKFYQDVVGLEPMATPGVWPNDRWMHAGNFQVHLIGGRTQPAQPPSDVHFAFRVPSLADTIAVLDRHHVAWESSDHRPHQVGTRDDGVLQIYFRDPDGYRIEINQAPR
ncbi:MAG TPA: VOC family protein [Sphingomicrobium sp.]